MPEASIWRKLRRADVASLAVMADAVAGPRRNEVGMGSVSGRGEARPNRVPAYAGRASGDDFRLLVRSAAGAVGTLAAFGDPASGASGVTFSRLCLFFFAVLAPCFFWSGCVATLIPFRLADCGEQELLPLLSYPLK